MPRNLRTRAAVVLVVLLGSLWYLYPPKKAINLGLDLQGGIHLVLGVETDKHVASQTDRAAEDFKAALERRGIAARRVAREGLASIVVELASPQSWNDALTVANEFQSFDRSDEDQAAGRFRLTMQSRAVARLHGQPEAPGRLVLVAAIERLELVGHRERVVPRLRRGQLDDDRGQPLAGDAPGGDTAPLQRSLEVLRRAVGLAGHVLVGLDAEHEVDAALQVEAEVDRLLRRIQIPEGTEEDDEDDGGAGPEVPRHPCRPAPPRRARWRPVRTRASPGRRRGG